MPDIAVSCFRLRTYSAICRRTSCGWLRTVSDSSFSSLERNCGETMPAGCLAEGWQLRRRTGRWWLHSRGVVASHGAWAAATPAPRPSGTPGGCFCRLSSALPTHDTHIASCGRRCHNCRIAAGTKLPAADSSGAAARRCATLRRSRPDPMLPATQAGRAASGMRSTAGSVSLTCFTVTSWRCIFFA